MSEKDGNRRMHIGDSISDNYEALKQLSGIARVGFKRLSDSAVIPTKAHATDSGYDLVASEDVIIEPGETAVVPTGIAVQLPVGFEAQVRPRSGVTAKTKLRVQLGTIDGGYAGEIGVIVDNIGREEIDSIDLNTASIEYAESNSAELINGTTSESWEDFVYTPFPTYKIRAGDRIAQLVAQPLPRTESYEIEGDMEQSERGAGGFGSTDV